jgi:hypothetical protein
VDKKGVSRWYKYEHDYICSICYARLFNPTYYDNNKTRLIEKSRKNQERILCFKGKDVYLKENPRKGVCELCGAVKGIDCQRTSRHHIRYHPEDPLKDTIELCNSCHRKEHIEELGGLK